jgi:hypothetical protein
LYLMRDLLDQRGLLDRPSCKLDTDMSEILEVMFSCWEKRPVV